MFVKAPKMGPLFGVGFIRRHKNATFCNINNHNKIFTSSTAGPGLLAAPDQNGDEFLQQNELWYFEDNINETAAEQQGSYNVSHGGIHFEVISFLLTIVSYQFSYDFITWTGVMFVVLITFILFGTCAIFFRHYIPIFRMSLILVNTLVLSVNILIDMLLMATCVRYSMKTDICLPRAISLIVELILLLFYLEQIFKKLK